MFFFFAETLVLENDAEVKDQQDSNEKEKDMLIDHFVLNGAEVMEYLEYLMKRVAASVERNKNTLGREGGEDRQIMMKWQSSFKEMFPEHFANLAEVPEYYKEVLNETDESALQVESSGKPSAEPAILAVLIFFFSSVGFELIEQKDAIMLQPTFMSVYGQFPKVGPMMAVFLFGLIDNPVSQQHAAPCV